MPKTGRSRDGTREPAGSGTGRGPVWTGRRAPERGGRRGRRRGRRAHRPPRRTAAAAVPDRGGRPLVVRGRENLRRHGGLSLQALPDWEWTDVEAYETLRPGLVLVECRGEGTIRFPGYPAGRYRTHFLHRFEPVDGLIAASRECTNPIEHMRSPGIGTPHIDREGSARHTGRRAAAGPPGLAARRGTAVRGGVLPGLGARGGGAGHRDVRLRAGVRRAAAVPPRGRPGGGGALPAGDAGRARRVRRGARHPGPRGGASGWLDVGGGRLLAAAPKARGVLVDPPHTLPHARAHLAATAGLYRVKLHGRDMFAEPLPVGGDVHLFSRVLGDWDDGHCVRPLRRVRAELSPQVRPLVVERMATDDGSGPLAALWGLHLLVVNGGRRRHRGRDARTGGAWGSRSPTGGPCSVPRARSAECCGASIPTRRRPPRRDWPPRPWSSPPPGSPPPAGRRDAPASPSVHLPAPASSSNCSCSCCCRPPWAGGRPGRPAGALVRPAAFLSCATPGIAPVRVWRS